MATELLFGSLRTLTFEKKKCFYTQTKTNENKKDVLIQSYISDLLIPRTSPEDSGLYTCVATNNFNKTQVFRESSSVAIKVKGWPPTNALIRAFRDFFSRFLHRLSLEVVSNPEISFEVIKEDSHSYSAAVTCQSAKGTPPVTFSLFNRTQLLTNTTTEDREATLKLPLVLGVNMDLLQCRANNGDQTAYSQWIPIEVGMNISGTHQFENGLVGFCFKSIMSPTVPVSSPVTMTYDYDVGENYAVIGVRFYCKAAAGSQPQYRWFLNETLLNDRGSFYYVVNRPPEQSILLLSVGRRSAGTYRCEVHDSFDNSSAISSKRLFVSKEGTGELLPLMGWSRRFAAGDSGG